MNLDTLTEKKQDEELVSCPAFCKLTRKRTVREENVSIRLTRKRTVRGENVSIRSPISKS